MLVALSAMGYQLDMQQHLLAHTTVICYYISNVIFRCMQDCQHPAHHSLYASVSAQVLQSRPGSVYFAMPTLQACFQIHTFCLATFGFILPTMLLWHFELKERNAFFHRNAKVPGILSTIITSFGISIGVWLVLDVICIIWSFAQ